MNGNFLRTAHVALTLAATAALGAVMGCGPEAPVLTLAIDSAGDVDANAIPADGLSSIALQAILEPATGAVVAFELDGVGLLSTTSSLTDDGVARVELFAPFESELPRDAAAVDAVVIARVVIDDVPQEARVDVGYVVPAVGAPALRAFTTPDRVTAGGAQPITLVIDGLRLPGNVATLTTSPPLDLPASLELASDDGVRFHGELVVPAAATAGEVAVTVTVAGDDGTVSATATLQFTAEGAPAFDLTGTFAQITYGTVEVDDFPLLARSPQCVIAPAITLVTIVQTGAHLSVDSIACKIDMPTVDILVMGSITPTVPQSFVDAANAAPQRVLEFDLGSVDLGAEWAPPASAMDPLIVGVTLASPDDALPTDGRDGRVDDPDEDGRPGVTIFTGDDAQETAYRTRVLSMTGSVESSDLVVGEIASRTETVVFNSVGGLGPEITDQPSPFFLVRVDGRNGADDISLRDGDGSSISCDDVRAYDGELTAQSQRIAPNDRTACQ